MGIFSSPYKRAKISARAFPGRRAKIASKPGLWSGDNTKGLARTKHDFSPDTRQTKHLNKLEKRAARMSAVQICRYCKQPKFAVENQRCTGRR